MTFEDIAKRLDTFQSEVRAGFQHVDEQLKAAAARDAAIEAEMRVGFHDVNEELNAAKIRDERAHDMLKFSLEAREGLRESIDGRFDAMGKKHDEEIDLLKAVLGHVTGTRSSR